jgi:hypothetical protein
MGVGIHVDVTLASSPVNPLAVVCNFWSISATEVFQKA